MSATTPARLAGVGLPLAAIRGERDCGIGELPDLAAFAEWAAALGQRIIALLPLGESAPGEPSPYSALSSFAIDPLYVSPADLPELAGDPPPELPAAELLLDRVRVAAWKRPLWNRAFERFRALPPDSERRRALERFRRAQSWLADYALFRALYEEQRSRGWTEWPAELRDREPRALDAARERLSRDVEFFEWLQLAAAEQWDRARAAARGHGIVVYGDLPFAPSLHSADVWANRDAFDLSRTAGAPPDEFSATGQRWGLPMHDWAGQRASGWRWFRARARRMRDLYDLVRADHVVGLFRTWGFRSAEDAGAFDPPDEPAQIAQGREILEMLRDEIAPAWLVAEDLGVIPPWVRETLRELDTPGYKVFRWEHGEDGQLVPPSAYPECALAATGTHDTDTLVAWWRTAPPEERSRACAALEIAEPANDGGLDEVTRLAMLERLWASPSRYVVVPLQDLFGWEERVNVPATVGGANWRWRLPSRIAELPRDERIAALVRRARR